MAATNHQHRGREHLERLEHLEHLERGRREHLERRERLERLEHPEHPEHLEHQKNRRGISGYILAKRIYPQSMQEGVDYEIKVIELQIDLSDSQLPFYEEVPDQDFGIPSDHSSS